MSSSADAKDILDLGSNAQAKPTKVPGKLKHGSRRPTGMNREVYALLYADNKDSGSSAHSLIPTDSGSGYRQPKARLGRKHVRPWKWTPFTNPAREDGLELSHWRREADQAKPYPYAKFNKSLEIPSYTEEEYKNCLSEPSWTKDETDNLMELCKRFDLRFHIVTDRFNLSRAQDQVKSVEMLKERYYSICNRLMKNQNPDVEESQLIAYDRLHETKRKEQLEKLLNRTAEQVQEEEVLMAELKKIEMRKKERERKQQDLQKLISAAEHNTDRKGGIKKAAGGTSKKLKSGGGGHSKSLESVVVFKSYDKSSGVSLRSSKMKIPMTLGQKKAKTIEQLLEELGLGTRPMPTEQICVQYNDLRNDILLLLELKSACDACEFELQSLKHRRDVLPMDKQASISLPELVPQTPKKPLASGLQIIDVVSSASGGGRKRRLATLDSAIKKQKRN